MALGAKTKLGFINGGCIRPDEGTDDLEKWTRADFMVMCWIIKSMTCEIREGFKFVSSAKELQYEIKERYAESINPLIYQLPWDLSNLRQGNMSIGAYYGKLRKIWDELQVLEAFLVYDCGGMNQYRCNILKKGC